MDNPKPMPALNEPVDVPEYFADAFTGTNWANGVMKLNFESHRSHYPHDGGPTLYRVAVCKIVVPLAIAEEMIQMLTESVARAKAPATGAVETPAATIN